MKAARLSRVIGTIAIAGVLPTCFVECAGEPKPHCITSPVPYAVRLVEQSRTGTCDTFGPATFNANPQVGVEPYYPRDSKGQPDYDHGSVAIKTGELGDLIETTYATTDADGNAVPAQNLATDGDIFSLGPFTGAESDDNNFCNVPTLAKTHLVLAAIPDDPATAADESLPPVDITLEWSNLQIYVTAAIFGTQFQADLADVRVAADGSSCTIRYRAFGLAPAVSCVALDMDMNPITNPDGSFQLDPGACDSNPDPAANRYVGSGISPSAQRVCDPIGTCLIPAGASVPALQ